MIECRVYVKLQRTGAPGAMFLQKRCSFPIVPRVGDRIYFGGEHDAGEQVAEVHLTHGEEVPVVLIRDVPDDEALEFWKGQGFTDV